MSGVDWKKAIAESDGRIAELEARGESDRIDFQLRLASMRNVKAARAVLADHDGDVDELKESEPWLFTDAPVSKPQDGTAGFPNESASSGEGKTMRRWRKLAELADSSRSPEWRLRVRVVKCAHLRRCRHLSRDYRDGAAGRLRSGECVGRRRCRFAG